MREILKSILGVNCEPSKHIVIKEKIVLQNLHSEIMRKQEINRQTFRHSLSN